MPQGLAGRSKSLRATVCLHALVTITGVAVAICDIESIVGSGPALSIVGGILAVLAFRDRDLLPSLLGISSFALAALVVALINLVPYSPTTGYWPLLAVIGAYASVAMPFSLWLGVSRKPLRDHTGE